MDGWSEGKHSALVAHGEPDHPTDGHDEGSGPRSEDSGHGGAHTTGGAHVRPGPVRVGASEWVSRGGAHAKGGAVDLGAPAGEAARARPDVGHGNAAAHSGGRLGAEVDVRDGAQAITQAGEPGGAQSGTHDGARVDGALGPHSAASVRAERRAALGTIAAAVAPTRAGTAAVRGGVLPQRGVDEDYMRLLAAGGALIFGASGLLLYRRRFTAG